MKKMKIAKVLVLAAVSMSILFTMGGCSSKNVNASNAGNNEKSIEEITAAAKKEGKVVSVGMPDSWADWKDTWDGIKSQYGISHTDTDMSSAEEISKFLSEKNNPTADIGDVGINFGSIAISKGVTQPYKTTYWNDVPSWAKDKDGNWVGEYTGTIAIITNKKLVKNPPKSWADLLNGDYKISIGDVTKEAQAQSTVLAAAMANGGSETNIQPGLDYFAKIAKQGRLSMVKADIANMQKGEVAVAIMWDFNALGYRDKINKDDFDVCIPSDGSLMSAYVSIINKYAPDPNAAKLAREYILSDAGQINLAKGYARPIRSNVKLPDDVKTNMLPDSQYSNVKNIKDYSAWEKTSAQLPQDWQEKVLINVK
ncbi:ABC transporter substrate-binding protein [Clostridium sp. 19966]|uniref:ABC transporter substrate-binding protein n=1 Tax=Clostridium sp. 19966 TaxID=2768166 RepID=UPI0028DFB687|nr:ABC transporter substrate-binding protein [Clostridium sp. 19966]MDT8715989.1 ABC transporter substrate-binding protein [Clostridium sp. 19966]